MSSTQHQVMMESSLAVLGRLELTPSSPTAVGVSRGPLQLSSGGGGPPPANEKNGQPPPPGSHLNGCVPLSHQVAGHKFGVDTVGILQHPDGTVLKQLQPPPRGPREMQFYSMVYAEDCCDPCLLELQNHLPKYYGTWSSPDSPKDLYLKLEDVTRRFIKPCIMDVKLGQRSYDPFASQEKRTDQIRKYPLMEEIGFLVLGMRVYKVCSDSFDSYDQHYGRGLVKDTIKDGLSKFFHNGAGLRKDAVSASIRRVRHILRWFESQRQLVFYASSLLFVYEGFTSSSPTSTSSTSPSSSSPPSSLSSTPLISPPTEKPASTEVGGDDDGKGRRGHVAGQEEGADVTEYNNNNIRVAVPLDYSLATMYANHRRGGHHLHYCAKGQFHGNGDSTTKTSGPVTNVIAPSSEEDNSPWKHMAGRRPQPNGNGIRSQLESEEEEEEQEGRREGEAERRATRRDTSKQKRDGGNGGEEEEVEVRMIDFAHVFSSDSHDHGYVYGLKHLLAVLEQILHESS